MTVLFIIALGFVASLISTSFHSSFVVSSYKKRVEKKEEEKILRSITGLRKSADYHHLAIMLPT